MLSESGKMTRPELMAKLPPIERPITVRIKFSKVGKLQYISHLDLQRTFNRILIRSGLPIWYTKGFNPHAKLVFATPLSIGTESECELLDLRLDREMDAEDIKQMLNAELAEEMRVTDVYIPSTKFSDIAFCEYEYELFFAGASAEKATEIEDLLKSSPLNMIKKTKNGEREIDIVPLVRWVEATYDAERDLIAMKAVLSAGSDSFLNPEMLITALKCKLGLFGDISKEYYSIMRKKTLCADLTEFK